MYWRIGEYLSEAMKSSSYGDGFIQSMADFFAENYPEIKGLNRRGLYRMKQFFELYAGTEIVTTLLTQLVALSRSLSPTMISEYTLKLIDKHLLQKKLKEYIELSETGVR